MKRNVLISIMIVAALLLIPAINYAQTRGSGNVVKQERQVDDFKSIKLSCSIDLYISQGPKSVVVRADDNLQEIISTDVSGGTLVVDIKGRGVRSAKAMDVYITMPDLEKIQSKGSGDIEIKNSFKCNDLVVAISGSGDFDADVHTTNLDLEITGSGDVELSNVTGTFKAVLMGSGDVEAEDLRCEKVYIKSSGSGDIELDGKADHIYVGQSGSGDLNAYGLNVVSAEVNNSGSGDMAISVSDDLKVTLNGSGDLTYRGNPKNVDINTTGSGDVYKK